MELLNQAGWRDSDGDGILDKVIDGKRIPLRFEIKVNSGNAVRKSVALVLLDELKKHGIAASVRELDWTIFLNDVKNHQLRRRGSRLGDGVDRTRCLSGLAFLPGGEQGVQRDQLQKSRESTRYWKSYRREFDPQKRIEMYKRVSTESSATSSPTRFFISAKRVSAVQRRFRRRGSVSQGSATDRLVGAAEMRQKYVSTLTPQ